MVHKGEMVFNRKDRLKEIASNTIIRSKILSGAQKPTRLANGAIAKSMQGSTVVSPTPYRNLNESILQAASTPESCNSTGDLRIGVPSLMQDSPNNCQSQLIVPMSSLDHSNSNVQSQEVGCSPEKRKKLGDARNNNCNYSKTFTHGLKSGNIYSGRATIIASKLLPLNPESTQVKGIEVFYVRTLFISYEIL